MAKESSDDKPVHPTKGTLFHEGPLFGILDVSHDHPPKK